ncbi:NAD-P-binding protein [Lentinula detonsa]|uniref:NAD-P-binding protein n=1 Tax=Lentinula detonsa TaxID=2804962 RepID=A0A9W8P2H3_9AGAR|nr:NAD-P-binding protein [Lentinula detonsa]
MLSQRLTRVALVTGAAQGIGKAIALRLASDGLKIALNDIQSKGDQLESIAEEIKKSFGSEVYAFPGDVSEERDVEYMVEAVSKGLGSLDVMVANAGISGPLTPILATTKEQWDDILRVNSKGVFLCYKYAAKQMVAQGRSGGRIIGASSVTGKQGMAHTSAYTASKFAVRGLTQVAALEFGQYGITVNAYAPGAIESPMSQAANLSASQVGKAVSNSLPSFSTLGKTGDVAGLVSYLASQESGYITGQTISINGGMYFD